MVNIATDDSGALRQPDYGGVNYLTNVPQPGATRPAAAPLWKPTPIVPTAPMKEPPRQPVTTTITLTQDEHVRYKAMSGRQQFEYLQRRGNIPADAVYDSQDSDGSLNWHTSQKRTGGHEVDQDEIDNAGAIRLTNSEYDSFQKMTGRQQFEFLQKRGNIPPTAVYDNQGPDGALNYHITETRRGGHEEFLEEPPLRLRVPGHEVIDPQDQFELDQAEGNIPNDAVFKGQAPNGGYFYQAPQKKAPVVVPKPGSWGKYHLDAGQQELKNIYDKEAKRPGWQDFLLGRTVDKMADGRYVRIIQGEAPIVGTAGSLKAGANGLLKVMAAISGGAAVYEGKEFIDKAKAASQSHERKTGEAPTLDDVVAIDSRTGAAMSLGDFSRRIPQGWIEVKRDAIPGKGEYSRESVLKGEGLTFNPRNIKSTDYPGVSFKPDTYIMDPIGQTKDAEDYLLRSASAATAMEGARRTFVNNWDDIIGQARDLNNAEVTSALNRGYQSFKSGSPTDANNSDPQSAFARYRSVKGASPADVNNREVESSLYATAEIMRTKGLTNNEFMRAFNDYARKRAILEDARRSYVASLNPAPLQGTVNRDVVYILAGYKLATYINTHPTLTTAQRTQLLNQVRTDMKTGATTKQYNAFQTSLQNALQTKTQAQTRTATATSTATKTGTNISTTTRTSVRVNTNVRTNTRENARTREKTATRTRARIRAPERRPKKKPEEHYVPVPPGTLAWEQGELKAGTVYKVAEPPAYKTRTSVGHPPKGYVDTGNTPKATIQTIGGPVTRHVDKSIGIVTAHADPSRREITFTRNPRSNRSRRNIKPRNLGAGIVVDRRGRHLRLY